MSLYISTTKRQSTMDRIQAAGCCAAMLATRRGPLTPLPSSQPFGQQVCQPASGHRQLLEQSNQLSRLINVCWLAWACLWLGSGPCCGLRQGTCAACRRLGGGRLGQRRGRGGGQSSCRRHGQGLRRWRCHGRASRRQHSRCGSGAPALAVGALGAGGCRSSLRLLLLLPLILPGGRGRWGVGSCWCSRMPTPCCNGQAA